MKFMWVALGKMVLAFAMGTYVVLGSACQVAWDSYLLHGVGKREIITEEVEEDRRGVVE